MAIDPRTGEILAMVSQPSYDPNDFAIRISNEEWQPLNDGSRTPLLNRAIQAQLAPGSIFKIVMTTAMLESKDVPANFTVFCPGYAEFYGRTFHCWRPAGHGVVDLHKAIVDSCDVYFYNVGQRLGIDRIHKYATELGLGRRTGIDLPGEEPGLMPSEEWKQRVFHQKWYAGETISVSIGQGAVTVTPMQLACTVGGIASGRRLPSAAPAEEPDHAKMDLPVSEATVEQVTQAMYGVVNEGGTGIEPEAPGHRVLRQDGYGPGDEL